jgi:hypothetical protein
MRRRSPASDLSELEGGGNAVEPLPARRCRNARRKGLEGALKRGDIGSRAVQLGPTNGHCLTHLHIGVSPKASQ